MILALQFFKVSGEMIDKEAKWLYVSWDYLPRKRKKEGIVFLEAMDKLNALCEFHIFYSKYY